MALPMACQSDVSVKFHELLGLWRVQSIFVESDLHSIRISEASIIQNGYQKLCYQFNEDGTFNFESSAHAFTGQYSYDPANAKITLVDDDFQLVFRVTEEKEKLIFQSAVIDTKDDQFSLDSPQAYLYFEMLSLLDYHWDGLEPTYPENEMRYRNLKYIFHR
jgi:hypothetical protein